jgi:hypothetical protein
MPHNTNGRSDIPRKFASRRFHLLSMGGIDGAIMPKTVDRSLVRLIILELLQKYIVDASLLKFKK